MQASDAFKLGFLARCVEEGFSPEQTCVLAKQAMEKQADPPKVKPGPLAGVMDRVVAGVGGAAGIAGDAASRSADIANKLMPYFALGLLAPPAAGGLAAYVANVGTDAGATTTEDIRRRELRDTYIRMTEHMQRAQDARKFKRETKNISPVYL